MANSKYNHNTRFKFVGLFVVFLVVIILVKMFEIGALDHNKYVALAEEQQRFEKTEIAKRGKIFVHDSMDDSNSIYPLAFDIKSYQILAIPKQIKDKNQTATEIASATGGNKADILSKIDNDKLYIPPLVRGISYDSAQTVKSKKLSGILLIPENKRFYPENTLASQILGFVNMEGKGNYGFEGHYDKELQGTAGKMIGEQDTYGRVIALLDQKNAKDGTSYVLTLDRSVQYFVEQKLKAAITEYQADSGTVVIIDIKTGGVVAMASQPDYNPNNYKEVANQNQALFVNPAIAQLYEPGSIFKALVMSAALDTGAVTPETENVFDWHTFVGGYEIKTAERKAFGKENMTQILQNSDNVGMVWVSEKLGKEKMYQYLQNFNMFDKTGIDLDTEVSGYAPPVKEWRDITRSTIAFGQGIAVSPLQMVAAYAAIANGGIYEYPHIVDKIIFSDGSEKQIEKKVGAQIIKKETADIMAGMLQQVVEGGHSKRAGVAGFNIAAKTGTAQVPKAGGGYEENDSGLGIFIHSLAGFAPVENPRFAMLVKLDKPKTARYAESTAAPLFSDIASFLLNFYYRLPANK